MTALNATHDPALRSWVDAANDDAGDFPIQNLPFGIFSTGNGPARGGVAIGDRIVDLAAIQAAGLLDGAALVAAGAASGPLLNPLLALGNDPASALRARLSVLLRNGAPEQAVVAPCLVPMAAATLHLPVAVRQFTDMSVSSFHAGRSRGNDSDGHPLVRPTFQWQPVGYNGRASSVVVSGTSVRRPNGQWLEDPRVEDARPVFGPEPRQDYEMEMAIWIGGPANPLGTPVSIDMASTRIFGFSVMNDWSARRIQVREAVLGPFLSKGQGTTVSPWIVTAEALVPFRVPAFVRPPTAPAPLPYLMSAQDAASGGYDIALESSLSSAAMRAAGAAPHVLCKTNHRYLYWTWAQIVAHHASNGCDLAAGDLIGSGTCSGPELSQAACLSEMTRGGTIPYTLPGGEQRTYLADHDILDCRARASRKDFVPIGFGPCNGEILPAPPLD